MRICDKELLPTEVRKHFKTKIEGNFVVKAMQSKVDYYKREEAERKAEIEKAWEEEYEVGWNGEYVLLRIEASHRHTPQTPPTTGDK